MHLLGRYAYHMWQAALQACAPGHDGVAWWLLSHTWCGLSCTWLASQVGGERYNLFTGCPSTKTATIVLRGGSEQFIDEAERSLHDAIMIVRRALKHSHVVAGGGAIDMEVRHLGHVAGDAGPALPSRRCLLQLNFPYCMVVTLQFTRAATSWGIWKSTPPQHHCIHLRNVVLSTS